MKGSIGFQQIELGRSFIVTLTNVKGKIFLKGRKFNNFKIEEPFSKGIAASYQEEI